MGIAYPNTVFLFLHTNWIKGINGTVHCTTNDMSSPYYLAASDPPEPCWSPPGGKHASRHGGSEAVSNTLVFVIVVDPDGVQTRGAIFIFSPKTGRIVILEHVWVSRESDDSEMHFE